MLNRNALLGFLFASLVLLSPFSLYQAAGAAGPPNYPEVMFILDASGSMWGKTGGETKIEAAKKVMARAVPALPAEVRVGLTAYGHRRKGDCGDVEVLIPSGSDDRAGLLKKVKALSPKGKTPMAASIKMVADKLKTKENETTIILVSDGIETCHDDPCAMVKALKQAGVKFILHVVGFGVDAKATAQLECMAAAGGGKYFGAGDAAALASALEVVKKDVAVKVEKAKTKKVKAKSRLGKLKITMPGSGVKSLAEIRIIRAKDDKLIKKAGPAASATHPLLAGKYKLVLAFANSNYQKPSEAPIGEVEIVGGETAEVKLGCMVINLAKGLGNTAVAVSVMDQQTAKTLFTINAKGNDYYLFKPKPLPQGRYTLVFVVGPKKFPLAVAGDIEIQPAKETVVTIDSGISLKKGPGAVGWDLIAAGQTKPMLQVRRRFDNDWPLWKAFPVPPGAYDIQVLMKGMEEPLPVGEGVEVKKGQTIVFDPGL